MRVKKCRVCGTVKLVSIGSLGKIAMSDFTPRPQKGTPTPLELVFCKKCELLQLAHDFKRENLYANHYWYESSLNPTIVSDLKSVVADALSIIKPHSGDSWIDIGANDGTLLSFVPKPFFKIGIDPASNLIKDLEKHADLVIQGFFDTETIHSKAKVITAIAMFYDLPDPNMFTLKIKNALAPNGIGIIQLMTLSPMIENNDVGNICHEHVEYYSYKSLVTLFEKNGLEIFKVKTNNMNGGSYRLFIRHKKKGSISFTEKRYTVSRLKTFFKRVEKNKQDFLKFLAECKKQGKTVVAYGASTKGNTVFQYYKLDNKTIPLTIDINPEKLGRFLINSKVPITNTIPDCDYIWILPYGFLDFFIKKEHVFRKKGGKFVVSTPEFKIV